MSEFEDDGPPPLDDLDDEISAIKQRREPFQARVDAAKQAERAKQTTLPAISSPKQSISQPKPLNPGHQIILDPIGQPPNAVANAPPPSKKREPSMFGGLAGGFFGPKPITAKSEPIKKPTASLNQLKPIERLPDAKSTSSSQSTSPNSQQPISSDNADDIPMIRANPSAASHNSLRFDEVQTAMNPLAMNLAKADINTPDFMAKLQSHPTLFKSLTNPRIAAAVSEIQKDPKKAMVKYSNDEEVASFIVEFTKLMTSHLQPEEEKQSNNQSNNQTNNSSKHTSFPLINQVSSSSTALATQSSQSTQQLQRNVSRESIEEWMANPVVRAALNDPATGEMLTALGKDQSLLPRFATDRRIQILIKAGILDVPPEYRS